MRQDLWDSMLDADMNARYWRKLAKLYSSIDTSIKIFLALLASGTVAGWKLWANNPEVWKSLSAIAAIVSIILPIIQLPKTMSKMSDLAGRWLQIKTDYELLWTDYKKNENNQYLSKRYRDVKAREVSAKKTETDLPEYDWLIKKCYNEVILARGLTSAN
jgi:hypothetical protein